MLLQNFSRKVEHGGVVEGNKPAVGALLVVDAGGLRLQVVSAKEVAHRVDGYAKQIGNLVGASVG